MAWIIAALIALVLLIRFPKAVIGIVLFIVGGLTLLWMNQKHEDEQERILESKVLLGVHYDLEACSEEYPLAVVIQNDTEETVERVEFRITMKRPG